MYARTWEGDVPLNPSPVRTYRAAFFALLAGLGAGGCASPVARPQVDEARAPAAASARVLAPPADDAPTNACFGLTGRSPGGATTFEIEASGDDATVVLRTQGRTTPVRIGLPHARNLEACFVAGDHLLASWSCGQPCEIAKLYDARGRELAVLQNPLVSPDGTRAASLDLHDLATGESDVTIIDLATGHAIAHHERQRVFNRCKEHWKPDAIVFEPCSDDERPIALPFAR